MRCLVLVVIVLLAAAAFGCEDGENGSSVAEPSVAGTAAATASATATGRLTSTGTPYPYPSPFVTPTPESPATPLPDPERTVEGTGTPAGCFPSSPNPSEAALDLGDATRYARGIYTIGLEGSGGPILFVERPTAVVGAAAWNPLYQTYSATPDRSALAFVAGQQVSRDRAELRLLDSSSGDPEPQLLATFNEIMNLTTAPQGDLVAVRGTRGNDDETYLHLVDTATGAVTPVPLTIQYNPGGQVAWSPGGDWLAVAGQEDTDGTFAIHILRHDGTGLKRLATGGPHLAWSPDGSRIAFAVPQWEEGAGIYVTDLDGQVTKVSESVVSHDGAPPLVWSPDGRCLAFATAGAQWEDPSSLRVLDVETGWEVYLTSGVTHPVWSPDGSRIAFLRDGNLWVMNTDGSQQTRLTNPTQPFVQEPAWLPHGLGLWFAYVPPMATSVRLVNIDGTGEVDLADGSEPSWSPDGTQIAFRGGGSGPALGVSDEIYVMNSDGTGVRKIGDRFLSDAIAMCSSWRPYAWSPDGRFIGYDTDEDPKGARAAPADGSNPPEVLHARGISWSPDGRQFAYSGGESGREGCQVYVQDFPAAGEPRWLAEGRHAVWSPDGQRIAFVASETAGGGDVYVINVDGTGLRKLMSVGSTNYLPLVWSPDGSRLAVRTDGLFVVDIASGEKRKLAEEASYPLPTWSSDSTRLAYTSWYDPNDPDTSSIYVVYADGSGEPQEVAMGNSPSWSPDGSRIAFAR